MVCSLLPGLEGLEDPEGTDESGLYGLRSSSLYKLKDLDEKGKSRSMSLAR